MLKSLPPDQYYLKYYLKKCLCVTVFLRTLFPRKEKRRKLHTRFRYAFLERNNLKNRWTLACGRFLFACVSVTSSLQQFAKDWRWFIYTLAHVLNLLLYAWLSACHVCWLPARQLGSFGKPRSPVSSETAAGNIPLDESDRLSDWEKPCWPSFSSDWLVVLESQRASQITFPDPVVCVAQLLSPFQQIRPMSSLCLFNQQSFHPVDLRWLPQKHASLRPGHSILGVTLLWDHESHSKVCEVWAPQSHEFEPPSGEQDKLEIYTTNKPSNSKNIYDFSKEKVRRPILTGI